MNKQVICPKCGAEEEFVDINGKGLAIVGGKADIVIACIRCEYYLAKYEVKIGVSENGVPFLFQ